MMPDSLDETSREVIRGFLAFERSHADMHARGEMGTMGEREQQTGHLVCAWCGWCSGGCSPTAGRSVVPTQGGIA